MALGAFDQPAPPEMFEEVPRPPRFKPLPEGRMFDETGSAPGDELNDYESRIRGIIEDAREFNAEVLLPIRERGIQFYLGLLPELDEEGRSTIVATEVRDTVLQMLPSLMRLFTAQDSSVHFIPTSSPNAKIAEQQTDYINYVFNFDNPGYLILQDVFKDGMIKAMGVVQWWTDENLEVMEERYERLSLEQRQWVISQPNTEVVEMTPTEPQTGPQGEIQPRFNMTVRLTKRAPKHRVVSVPPDEFRISRQSTCIKDAPCVGRESFKTQTELMKLGVKRYLIELHQDFSGGDMRFTQERVYRNPGSDSPFGRDTAEPVCRWGEYWIRIDKDGDGLAELRHICTIGDNSNVVIDEPANRAKMAICCPDPEPHSIVGHGIAELIADLQIIKTNLLRGSLDSLAQAIYPRLWGVDQLVDWDDVLNTSIGAPIRVKDGNALGQLAYQFIGDPAFQMMDRLDAIRMARTGISEQSKGLDPKALQSMTLKGVDMIVQGAQERIELVARTMASTFMVDLFSGLLEEVTEKPVPERVIKLRGEYVPVNPDQFDATMICTPNPAMGRGSDMDRYMMLGVILQKQEMIMQTMGPANPMVTPIEYRNAIEDTLSIAGMKNCERYFRPMNEETLANFQKQINAKEDPNMVLAKAEADKVRASIIKILTDARVKAEDLTMQDDRDRDKFEGDQMLKAFDIDAKYGASVDTAAISALWSAPRVAPTAAGPAAGAGAAASPPPQPDPLGALAAPAGAGGSGTKPELPSRSALGRAPPKLLNTGGGAGAPPGLLSPSGPGL